MLTAVPSFAPVLPEIFLAVAAMALLLLGAFRGEGSATLCSWLAVGALAIAIALVLRVGVVRQVSLNGMFITDGFGAFMKVLALGGSALSIMLSLDYNRRQGIARFEYAVLILLATAGMMMMISAYDLISLYVGLELQSLALYVVASFDRDSVRSTEAGLKYFVLGALASGMLLFGASMVYGFAGATGFEALQQAFQSGGARSIGLLFGIIFIIVGLAFKVSAVPFHMWTPDVYEGAPTPVTAFFAAAPKVAGIAMFVRVAVSAFPSIASQWQQIVVFVSIASMALGSFAAIGQRNIKRLMAYSSIGHMGFALIGLAAGSAEGVQGVLVYIAIYVTMTLGVFAVILSMRRSTGMVENVDQLAGLARTHPAMAFFMAVLLFSMAGIPPLAGFFAKYFVFTAAIKAGFYILAVIGVVTSVVGAYYYLVIIKTMYFDEPAGVFVETPYELSAVLVICGLFNILFIVHPGPLIGAASAAAHSLF